MAGFRAFPAQSEMRDEIAVWRASGGFNFRNSSVTLFAPPPEGLGAFLGRVTDFCKEHGITPVLRLPAPVSVSASDLQEQGWREFRRAIVMLREHRALADDVDVDGIAPVGMDKWLAVQREAKGQDREESAGFDAVMRQVGPQATPILWREDGRARASALLFDDGGMFGLMNMLVSGSARGRGVGRRFLSAILARTDGAEQPVWLQVMDGNEAAQALYESAGFLQLYEYRYWRPR